LIGRHASHREISVETTAKILRTHVERNQAPIVRQKTVTHRDAGRRRLVAVFRHARVEELDALPPCQNGSMPRHGTATRASPGNSNHCRPRTMKRSSAAARFTTHPIDGSGVV
jgi:hypothetical protein